MGSLPELRRLAPGTPSPPPKPRHSFGAATVLQVRHGGQTLVPALLEAQGSVGNRRRESCASSVGATSVRRLVRGGTNAARGNGAGGESGEGDASEAGERWRRRRSALAVCGARAVAAAALLPLQALQGTGEISGNSTLGLDPGGSGGASLLASLHLSASITALVAPAIVKHARATTLLPVGYLMLSAFCAAHLYPELYILLPAYIAAGACWTPISFARDSLISALACSGASENLAQQAPQRRTLLRRLSRASRAARDLGLLVASLLIPLLTPIAVNNVKLSLQPIRNCVDASGSMIVCRHDKNTTLNAEDIALWRKKSAEINITVTEESWPSSAEVEDESEEWREKECGSNGCPKKTSFGINASIDTTVAIALCCCCLLAVCCSAPAAFCSGGLANCALGKDAVDIIGDGEVSGRTWSAAIRAFKDVRARAASPLALFIGLEQGFLYSHFLQWYVVCVSGDGQLWRALAGAALLRALVATTLSMLLAHGRRKIVASVGLTWHACLLLAMSIWRAARADKQLPLVMAAAWAGCDAVWELLLPTLIDEPIPGGRTALCLSLRSLGLALAFLSRAHLCVNWAIRPLILALPAAALPLLFAPDP